MPLPLSLTESREPASKCREDAAPQSTRAPVPAEPCLPTRTELATTAVAGPEPTTFLGLGSEEAERRLRETGPNIFGQPSGRSLVDIVRSTLREPMFLLLLAAAGLYLAFGDLGEGLFLVAGALISIGLVVVQEAHSERALAALRELAEPVARVIRDGHVVQVPARTIVPGDALLVGEGERLPADAQLVAGDALVVNESALTGEAATVTKRPSVEVNAAVDPTPGEDSSAHLFAGTLNVRGQGTALVTRTGVATRLGRIGASLATIADEPTLLQRTVGRLIARLAVLALGLCALVVVAYGLVRDDWFEGALAGITLAIALLPEEFPMVLAVFTALGAWRLARHQVLVRRGAVIETLGATTLLCVDKTGTLTENRMTVAAMWRDGAVHHLAPDTPLAECAGLLRTARLASSPRPLDPMDAAVHCAAGQASAGEPLRSYPLRPDFLAFVQVWSDNEGVVYAAKGAPETIVALCELGADEASTVDRAVADFASRGMRVLGVAAARLPVDPVTDPATLRFVFEGLIAFVDPVRADVPDALAEARRAGISVAMITGDYPATAQAIARDAGIDVVGGVLTGKDVGRISADALPERVRDVRVFARVMPEQKLALVDAFKRAGHVVAMTGDGVNDAPALVAAHIGIAMGKRGTDVAREAADLVLLDDRFASIVGGVRLGRRIFANLRRALTYITAIHVPIAGLALLPILMGLPPLLYPMHVVLLELLIDPVCSLVFEGEPSERDAMSKPPRPANETLFGTRQVLLGIMQGAVVLTAVLATYWWTLSVGTAEPEARAAAFVALVAGNLALALADASGRGSPLFGRHRLAFWAIAAAAFLVLAASLTIPAFADVLRFARPDAALLAWSAAAGAASGSLYALASRIAGATRLSAPAAAV